MEAASCIMMAWISVTTPGDKESASKTAIASAMTAKDLATSSGYKKGAGEALHVIAEAHALNDSKDECLASADEALDMYLEAKNQKMAAMEWISLSKWNMAYGSTQQAIWDAEDAVEVLSKIKSPLEKDGVAALCEAYLAAGKVARARMCAKDALIRFQETGDKEAEAAVLDVLVAVYDSMGQTSDAMAAAEKGLALVQDLGDKKLEAKRLSTVCQMHFGMEDYDRALQIGEDALVLLKDSGETGALLDVVKVVANSHVEKGDESAALDCVTEMTTFFEGKEDKAGLAACLILTCAVQGKMESYDEAASSATKAQEIFSELGDSKGEAGALRWICEVHTAKKEHKSAVKGAERARTLYREIGDDSGEAMMLALAAQNSVSLACVEGAEVGAERMSRAAKDALDKAAKLAKAAVKIGRDLKGEEQVLALALIATGQVLMLNMKFDEALEATDEAAILFREGADFRSEAQALLLSADALRFLKQYNESKEAANECLSLFQQQENTKGEELAQKILEIIEEIQRPMLEAQMWQQQQQWMQQQQMMGGPPQGMPQMSPQMMMQMQGGGGGFDDGGQSVARVEREKGAALDLSQGLDNAMVKNKLLEISLRITGAEDGEIEFDTPLMEAGLTSNSAILMRDELSQELPGLNLPVTLVFDYPTISDMSELILETSQKKLGK
jgi:tetratricopeptide (TPR) repeat protein